MTRYRSPVFVRATRRLVLRELRGSERGLFAAMNADPVVMRWYPRPLTRQESDALVDRIRATWSSHGYGLWAAERTDTGAVIGYVGLWPVPEAVPVRDRPSPCVEVGWRLAADQWGYGFATEGAAEAVRFAFDDLALSEVVSFTAATNARSRAVMDRIGMTRDPDGDFDHPAVPTGHPLRRHVLYRLRRADPSGAPRTTPASPRPLVINVGPRHDSL